VKGGDISGKKNGDTKKKVDEFERNVNDKIIRELYRDINLTNVGNLQLAQKRERILICLQIPTECLNRSDSC
jgi:nucleoid DNA-binding protein